MVGLYPAQEKSNLKNSDRASDLRPFRKFKFTNQTGYIVHPNQSGLHEQLALGHTALVEPWADPAIHLHESSEEFYILLQGFLYFSVGNTQIDLRPGEILAVNPNVPHAILGGKGPFEHFGMRTPLEIDKTIMGKIPQILLAESENQREIRSNWGYRIPLSDPANQNCWLLGQGSARFYTAYLILAYLNFPTPEAEKSQGETRHKLHYHLKSWEYYFVIEGSKTLQVGQDYIAVNPGEVVEIPPNCPHKLHSRETPFEGFTIRVPVELQDKIEC